MILITLASQRVKSWLHSDSCVHCTKPVWYEHRCYHRHLCMLASLWRETQDRYFTRAYVLSYLPQWRFSKDNTQVTVPALERGTIADHTGVTKCWYQLITHAVLEDVARGQPCCHDCNSRDRVAGTALGAGRVRSSMEEMSNKDNWRLVHTISTLTTRTFSGHTTNGWHHITQCNVKQPRHAIQPWNSFIRQKVWQTPLTEKQILCISILRIRPFVGHDSFLYHAGRRCRTANSMENIHETESCTEQVSDPMAWPMNHFCHDKPLVYSFTVALSVIRSPTKTNFSPVQLGIILEQFPWIRCHNYTNF